MAGLSAQGSQHILFETKFPFSLPLLALMLATSIFEQNGTRDPSRKGTRTPLDSTAIYPINPINFIH
jgi:hypothetical protein